jgi:hypothetical protein
LKFILFVRIADDILDDLVDSTAKEVKNIADEFVEHLLIQEFIGEDVDIENLEKQCIINK